MPGALSPAELWTAVESGRDLVSSAPEGRWGLKPSMALANDRNQVSDRALTDHGGYVRGFREVFDPQGFGLPVDEVLRLDPLFQWTLHTGREALRDAGLEGTDGAAKAERAGVVLGNLSFPSLSLARYAAEVWTRHAPETDARNRFMSGLPAQLLAKALGLGGDAFALDDACASSFYAIKLACDRLHEGRADVMLAGAVAAADALFIHVGFSALGALSPSGRSRPFHRKADGLLPAEGAVFVVLKRLDDAVADGDSILGVIRGVGLSNDGRGGGVLAPSEEGQERAIRQAYEVAGIEPSSISLVECHATGTAVGDAAEIRSLGKVYEGLEGVPIGSLKSNFGHLITAAGLAGLLKVLGALEAGVRPPTLHAKDPIDEIEKSPFRLIHKAEPWESEVPRRAALSAFGFGGNNAHLLVEEYRPDTPSETSAANASVSTEDPPEVTPEIAVVALAAAAGNGESVDDLARDLFTGHVRVGDNGARADEVRLGLRDLRFPPRDLEQSLSQQTLLLRVARQAMATLEEEPPRERTAVFVGMQCDAEVARYGLRWRLGDRSAASDENWLAAARDGVVPALTSAGVIGSMPNMPANRLNFQFDIGGASYSVSAEELSGLVALELAVRALERGEIDVAVVAAVDMSCEPVHERAAMAFLSSKLRPPGDGAVVLVLKRRADARQANDQILALVESADLAPSSSASDPDGTPEFRLSPDGRDGRFSLVPQLGYAHSATSLMHVAGGILSCLFRVRPLGPAAEGQRGITAVPWLSRGTRRAEIRARTVMGQEAQIRVREDRSSRASLVLDNAFPRLHLYTGDNREDVVRRLRAGSAPDLPGQGGGPARLVLVAASQKELAELRDRALELFDLSGDHRLPMATGIAYQDEPIAGERAFLFTSGAAAYAGMGRELLLALPELTDGVAQRVTDLPTLAGWIYDRNRAPASVVEQLWGSSFLSQIHAELTRHVLGIQPDATLGYSSGESNALMAMGAWNDLDDLHRESLESGLFHRDLGGEFRVAQEYWGEGTEWTSWVLGAPPTKVANALFGEGQVYLLLVNSPDESVIGGEAAACRRVIDLLKTPAYRLGYELSVHCPLVTDVADAWQALHRREVTPVDGVRFYTHADGGYSYTPDTDSAAAAILGQATTTIDFPQTLRRVWDDGVRIFIEHGPRNLLTNAARQTLTLEGVPPESWLAVSLDKPGGGLRHTANSLARLLAAGVDLDYGAFNERSTQLAPAGSWLEKPARSFAAHWPEVQLVEPSPVPLGSAASAVAAPVSGMAAATLQDPRLLKPLTVATAAGAAQWLPPAPALPPVLEVAVPAPSMPAPSPQVPAEVVAESVASPPAPPPSSSPPSSSPNLPPDLPTDLRARLVSGQAGIQALLAQAQNDYLASQAALHERFLQWGESAIQGLVRNLPSTTESVPTAESVPAVPAVAPQSRPQTVASPVASPVEPAVPESPPATTSVERPKITLSRADLEVHAGGRISSIFGPLFEQQDAFERQVRMPEPPLLLADRVTDIDAEAGSMGTGTLWTETDVETGAWYLHEGHMPAGIMIEAGQADLLLISWLGIDFLNRGERVYRLLGCELTYHESADGHGLPRPGETLRYDIHVDGHATQGDIRLFFFHYDCRVNDEPRLVVRGGQAGFFSDEELADSAGILWDPNEAEAEGERLDPPRVSEVCRHLSGEQLAAFSEGRVREAFGNGFELASTHSATPRIQAGRMLLLDEVTDLDPAGGPWKRGYLRARMEFRPDHWFFDGHFKNDPCMPGTLMFEGCLQAMAVYLTALGYTLERDGWRFEPVPDVPIPMRCRGQATPEARELIYEIFVHEVHDGPVPMLFADLLCTVDNLKAFHAQRMGLRLRPAWPLESRPDLLERFDETRPGDARVATAGDMEFGWEAMLATAWGRPSAAFGEMYKPFDGPRQVARLPSPPYHFMSRVTALEGEIGVSEAGAKVTVEYDVPPLAWYFSENGDRAMPFAVLLEVGLQPCGWLASYVGSPLLSDEDLQFRNLDGRGIPQLKVLPEDGTIRTYVELLELSQSGGMIIERFAVRMTVAGATQDEDLEIFSFETAFGFFPHEAMANQVGLPTTDKERAALVEPSDFSVDLTERPQRYCGEALRLAGPRLLMLDRITGYWPDRGTLRLGRLRAEKDVNPEEWFFKAHFFQDPVQPGSLGLEALLQLLQFYMLERGMAERVKEPRFEPIALGKELIWRYRGQVLPTDSTIVTELDITEVGSDRRGPYAVAKGWLWIDGRRIYSAENLAMRVVSGEE